MANCNCNASTRGGAHLVGCNGERVDRTDNPIPLPEESLPPKGEKLDEKEPSGRVERRG